MNQNLARRDLGWVWDHLAYILLHPVRGPPVGLLRPGLILKDAHRTHDATTSVEGVVGHEAGDLADEGQQPLIDLPYPLVGEARVQTSPELPIHIRALRVAHFSWWRREHSQTTPALPQAHLSNCRAEIRVDWHPG